MYTKPYSLLVNVKKVSSFKTFVFLYLRILICYLIVIGYLFFSEYGIKQKLSFDSVVMKSLTLSSEYICFCFFKCQ